MIEGAGFHEMLSSYLLRCKFGACQDQLAVAVETYATGGPVTLNPKSADVMDAARGAELVVVLKIGLGVLVKKSKNLHIIIMVLTVAQKMEGQGKYPVPK